MTRPTSTMVVRAAIERALRNPPITYAQMDCQAFVEACVIACGGAMDYLGSNDMFRNACTWVGTLQQARAAGNLVPGALLFVLKQDGNEPARYHADGLGNASHVGLYCADQTVEVAHSSSSKGVVCTTALANGWTHVGLAKCIDYDGAQPESPIDATLQYATVDVPAGEHVRMRAAPSASGTYMLRIPAGTLLCVTGTQDGFARVSHGGHTGWVSEAFLTYTGAADVADAEVSVPRAVLAAWAQELTELLGGWRPMSSEVLVAVLSLVGTLLGSIAGIAVANKLVTFRLEQLEKKVEQHNRLVERMAVVERDQQAAFRLLDEQAARLAGRGAH